MAKPRHVLRRKLNELELALMGKAGVAPPAAAEVQRAIEPLLGEVPEMRGRAEALARVAAGERGDYREKFGVAGVRQFATVGGATIYLMQVETFPDHVNNVYLVREGGRCTLYDCGSQTALSRDDLARAHGVLREIYGDPDGLDGVRDVVISHAHIDHFGGVGQWVGRATIHVHEFDARVLTRFEERIITAAMQVRVFLERAGVDAATRSELEQMYVFTKQLFVSVPVDRLLSDGQHVNDYVAHHVPGHCPGQICLQVHDVLLTADHILPRITPHQSPESITPWTGLDHYFQSLEKLRRLGGIDFALPGHEEPIARLQQRIVEIEQFHRGRLENVRELCKEPLTIAELSARLFGAQTGYGRLLALEEAAAHAEYLSRRGWLEIADLESLVKDGNPVLRYRTTSALA
jgi:glyoxylase-like metal-dependent hydrolase (beta-lactamase superfamily II)